MTATDLYLLNSRFYVQREYSAILGQPVSHYGASYDRLKNKRLRILGMQAPIIFVQGDLGAFGVDMLPPFSVLAIPQNKLFTYSHSSSGGGGSARGVYPKAKPRFSGAITGLIQ